MPPVAFLPRSDGVHWDDGENLNLALLVVLLLSLGALIIALLVIGIYFICLYASNDAPYYLTTNFLLPGSLPEEERSFLEQEARFVPLMPKADQGYYRRGQAFTNENPPNVSVKMGKLILPEQQRVIDDRGLDAFYFEYDEPLSLRYIVEERTEISFVSAEPSTAILNLPLPVKGRERDTVYFEVKLYELPGYNPDSIDQLKLAVGGDFDRSGLEASSEPTFCIGLVTKPYPLFRLPGYNRYSIGYENNGRARINNPFDDLPCIFPKLTEGDVVGVGFRPSDGSVFYTRNGKKLFDVIHGMKLNLFPAIGALNCAGYRFQVNLGQLGFVFIEANVKKWGLAKNYGTLGAPPAYGNDSESYTVIDKGEPIPPRYPSEEEDFFGNVAKTSETSRLLGSCHVDYQGTSHQEQPNTPVSGPPSYSSGQSIRETKTLYRDDASEHDTPDSHIDLRERLYERRSTAYGFEDAPGEDEGTSAQFLKSKAALNNAELEEDDDEEEIEQTQIPKIDPQLANANDTTITTILTSTTSSQEEPDSTTTSNILISSPKSPKSPLSPGGSRRKKKQKGKKRKKGKGKKSSTTF